MNYKTILATVLLIAGSVFVFWNLNARDTHDQPQSDRIASVQSRLDPDVGLLREKTESPTTASKPDPSSEVHSDRFLEELVAASKRKSKFVAPTKEKLNRFKIRLVETMQVAAALSTPGSEGKDIDDQNALTQRWSELKRAWEKDDWQLETWVANKVAFFAIAEQKDARSGRGIYVFRSATPSKIVLQAPHRFFDTGTGTIALRLMVENDCRAAVWNTAHRKTFDLAHQRDHHINSFTAALIEFDQKTPFVQIHGFANEKQRGNGKTASIIVSDGTKFPGRLARSVAANFKTEFEPTKVRLFPIDVRQLGGTTNEQGRLIRNSGCLGFLHLELNKEFRESLKTSASMRNSFFESLADSH